jgi:hypothetical protein
MSDWPNGSEVQISPAAWRILRRLQKEMLERINLEAAIEFPAKHAKHANTKAERRVCEARRLHPIGEW